MKGAVNKPLHQLSHRMLYSFCWTSVPAIIILMLLYVKSQDDGNKSGKSYHCSRCGAWIAHENAMITRNGSEKHSFVNPVGVRCNFITFGHCENIKVDDKLHLEHSWFPGYGWRFLVCGRCLQHLGWQYDATGSDSRPQVFFGVLIDSVDPAERGD
jgi:hypothetical protein